MLDENESPQKWSGLSRAIGESGAAPAAEKPETPALQTPGQQQAAQMQSAFAPRAPNPNQKPAARAPAAPPQTAPANTTTNTIAGTPASAPRNPYGGTPSGFVNFQQYLDANAGATNAQVEKINKQVRDSAQKAMGGLEEAEYQNNGAIQEATSKALSARGEGATGRYDGPLGFDPSTELQDAFTDATGKLGALGMGDDGIDALMGPGRDWFSAGLVGSAGADEFADTRKSFSGLSEMLGDARARGKDTANAASKRVSDYFGEEQAQDTEAIQREQLQRQLYEEYAAPLRASNAGMSGRQSDAGDGTYAPIMSYEEWLADEGFTTPDENGDE